jgi:hypothetical protein
MNFIEAMRKIDNDGCKIRRKVWVDGGFIYLRERIVVQEDGSLYDFCFKDYFADDWEEYTTLSNFEEALKALKSGATIKRKDYVITHKITHYNFSFDKSDLLANDWVILEE